MATCEETIVCFSPECFALCFFLFIAAPPHPPVSWLSGTELISHVRFSGAAQSVQLEMDEAFVGSFAPSDAVFEQQQTLQIPSGATACLTLI
jgi:hypothetical protein